MRKLILIIAGLSVFVILFGCSGSDNPTNNPDQQPIPSNRTYEFTFFNNSNNYPIAGVNVSIFLPSDTLVRISDLNGKVTFNISNDIELPEKTAILIEHVIYWTEAIIVSGNKGVTINVNIFLNSFSPGILIAKKEVGLFRFGDGNSTDEVFSQFQTVPNGSVNIRKYSFGAVQGDPLPYVGIWIRGLTSPIDLYLNGNKVNRLLPSTNDNGTWSIYSVQLTGDLKVGFNELWVYGNYVDQANTNIDDFEMGGITIFYQL